MNMETPQAGLFESDTRHHYHLEVDFPRKLDAQTVRASLAAMLAPAGDEPLAVPQWLVLSFGRSLWKRLGASAAVPAWEDFAPIGTGTRRAPSTQADLWIWIQSARHDLNFERALACRRHLPTSAQLRLELQSFVYRDSRDLSGFVDGTANPEGDERLAVAAIRSGSPGAGGSFALTQRWVHELEAFLALELEQQARVIGRSRLTNEELLGDAMPDDSHISRTDVEVGGVPQKIWRRSTPYGDTSEHGLYFVAFACEQRRFQIQLERMFGVAEDGLHDRLTDYSHAVSGSYWFTPSAADLAALLRTPSNG